jgi:putative MATE family efflux protein
MFGLGVIPGFGVNGAAYATLISRIIAAIMIFYYLLRVNKKVHFQLRCLLVFSKTQMRKVISLTYPIAGGELIWATGTFLYTLLFTRLGTDQLVASQIVTNIESIFIMFSFGISVAGLTLVAKEIGAGNFDLMKQKANALLKIGLVSAAIFGLMLFIISYFIHDIYPAISPNANNLAKWGMIMFALFQPVKVSNMIMGNGILKSGGITRFVAIVDVVVAFCIGLPAAYLLAFHFGMGFKGVIIGRLCEEVFRIVIFTVRYRVPNWYRVLVV